MDSLPIVSSKRHALGQLVFCQGCCCGRTDRGRPELPVERLKAVWKAEKLNSAIQLTISGCLGPCDVANVTLVITPDGMEWFGQLAGDAIYEAIIEWARACKSAGKLIELPERLESHRFIRFAPSAPECETTTPVSA